MKNLNKIKNDYNSLIKDINDKKYSKWYTLKDLVFLKDIGYSSLKNMVKGIYDKYHPQGTINKVNGVYQIHYSLLDKFKLKQPRTKLSRYSCDWKSNISWSTVDFYDRDYHQFLINILKCSTLEFSYLEAIEYDDNNKLHVHLMSDADKSVIEPIIIEIMDSCLIGANKYQLYCEDINNIGRSIEYLDKNPQ